MGMRQNYLFPWGGEIPCSENIEPSYLQIFDNKYFVYEQFRMLYRFSGPSDCWKIPFPRFLPTRNFPVLRNFSGFMDFASKYSGFEWQGVFRLADRSRIGRTTTEQGAARMRTDLKAVAGDRMHPPLPRRICRMRLLRSHADIRLPAHRGGRCCCSTMANEKSQPIINQLRFYFRVPRTRLELART